MVTSPVSGVSSPAMMRSRVDLPPPLGPSRAVSEPDGISTETSSRATNSPNRFVMRSAWMATSASLFGSDEVHEQQGHDGERGQRERRGVRRLLVEVLEALLDEQRKGLGLPHHLARHDGDRAELTQRAGQGEDDPVGEAPADRRQGDPPEGLER